MVKIVKGRFVKSWGVTVTAPDGDGQGTTDPKPGKYTLKIGEKFTITAIAAEGSYFEAWTVDGKPAGHANPLILEK